MVAKSDKHKGRKKYRVLLAEAERLNNELAVLRDCNAALAKERRRLAGKQERERAPAAEQGESNVIFLKRDMRPISG